MAKNFRELEAQLPAEVRDRAKLQADISLAEMFMIEIRKAMQQADPRIFEDNPELQQQIVAQDDLPLTTLCNIVQHLGGKLEVFAKLPNQTIQFPPLNKSAQDAA